MIEMMVHPRVIARENNIPGGRLVCAGGGAGIFSREKVNLVSSLSLVRGTTRNPTRGRKVYETRASIAPLIPIHRRKIVQRVSKTIFKTYQISLFFRFPFPSSCS